MEPANELVGHYPHGAPMGRRSSDPDQWRTPAKLYSVWVDAGGYDPGGVYWGRGEPLYELAGDSESHFFRARDRSAAEDYVAEAYPGVVLLPLDELNRDAPTDPCIDVTPIVTTGEGVFLSEPQAQAVRWFLRSLGLSLTDGELAEMGAEACAAALYDWVAGLDGDDPATETGDDGRVYFYAGE